VLVFFN